MEKRLQPAEVAALLTDYLDSQGGSNQERSLFITFQPLIKAIATRYRDASWQNDLIQEGNKGLTNAIRLFSPIEDRDKFLGYAIKAIYHAMADFARKHLIKSVFNKY